MENNKVRNSEILFIYEADGCNPNGDPDNGNRPRKDSQGFIEVTDLRLKRYIRDYMERFDNKEIVIKEGVDGNSISKLIDKAIDSDEFKKKMQHRTENVEKLEKEISELKSELKNKKDDEKKRELTEKESKLKDLLNEQEKIFLEHFKDIAYFGIVPGDNKANYLKFNYYGAVQFQFGKSYNKGEVENYGISPVFKTLGEDHRLRYGVIGFYGVVNGMTADKNYLTNEDIKILDKYIVNGVAQMSRFSRSKIGQRPLIYVRIEYKNGFIPQNLRKLVSIDKTEAICSTDDFKFDISKLVEKINACKADIESVSYFIADDLGVQFDIKDVKAEKLQLIANIEQTK